MLLYQLLAYLFLGRKKNIAAGAVGNGNKREGDHWKVDLHNLFHHQAILYLLLVQTFPLQLLVLHRLLPNILHGILVAFKSGLNLLLLLLHPPGQCYTAKRQYHNIGMNAILPKSQNIQRLQKLSGLNFMECFKLFTGSKIMTRSK